MRKIKEACGVFGIYARSDKTDVAEEAYLSLFLFSTEGRKAAGSLLPILRR